MKILTIYCKFFLVLSILVSFRPIQASTANIVKNKLWYEGLTAEVTNLDIHRPSQYKINLAPAIIAAGQNKVETFKDNLELDYAMALFE